VDEPREGAHARFDPALTSPFPGDCGAATAC
jgi:hypothetical protein